MNLEEELRKKQTKGNCNRIVTWIGDNEERFAVLMKLFFSREYRITQHAAWPMSYCIRSHPSLVKPYFRQFMDQLSDEDAHPAAKRNIVRLLQFVEVPKKYQGKLMDSCFNFINSPEEAIAVKAFSLTILENLSAVYPEIISEIRAVIEARWEFETAAFKSRGSKILKRLKS